MKSQCDKKKVFVGLSGGVDSAVSAAILHKAGYNVTGVFIKVWQPDWIECNWKDERREAMRVAAHLGIPFITLDLEKEYKEGVIDYMIAEYKAGRTPNPDVMCNREVKFGAFWSFAKSQGADYIATGHYSRIFRKPQTKNEQTDILNPLRRRREQEVCEPHSDGAEKRQPSRHFPIASARLTVGSECLFAHSLFVGTDKNKDQSYFLWTLNQGDLEHVLFPVGHLEKPEVRRLARKFKLPNAEKKDSQGLCFIGKLDVKDFLAHYIKTEPGNVLNEEGEVIGNHSGSLFFTIGERHGFTITMKTPDDHRYYVIDKDLEQNTITVSNKMIDGVLSGAVRMVRIGRVNWISETAPDLLQASLRERPRLFADDFSTSPNHSAPLRLVEKCRLRLEVVPVKNVIIEYPLQARCRYRQPLQSIKIHSSNIFEMLVEFEKPQDTISIGQSLVIYHGEECIGGGIIVE